MAAHATLSPSSSARWITCPGSLRVIDEAFPDGVPYESSPHAEEGTRAHEVAEMVARKRLGLSIHKSTVEYLDADEQAEMHHHAEFYADVLEQYTEGSKTKPLILLEQRVDTGIHGVWGTSDAILVVDGELYVVDFKYGRGVQVASDENSQLMLYALGALKFVDDIFGTAFGDLDTIHMTIVQPRTDTPLTETTISRDELEGWSNTVARPAATLAAKREGPVVPSEEACRWCPAAGVCKVRADKVVSEDFGRPAETLSHDELAEHLANIPDIEKWCRQVADYAMTVLYEYGEDVPGFKTVWKKGNRKIMDMGATIQAFKDIGVAMEDVTRIQMETLSRLDKLAGGKSELAELLGPALGETDGKPAIVSADDKRPKVTKADTAAEEFSKE